MSLIKPTQQDDTEEREIEIRVSDVILYLKSNRRLLIIGAVMGLVLSILYAFSKPNVFTAGVTVMPELQSKGASGLGSLGSLAGLAGISLDNAGGTDAIRPDLYPNILQSLPFALYLLKQPVYSEEMKVTLPLKYFNQRMAEKGFVHKIVSSFSTSSKGGKEAKQDPRNFSKAIQLTKEQEQQVEQVQATVSAVYEKKSGILTLSAVEQDPVVAATVARLSLEYLTNYIIAYRTEKARKQVLFLTQRVGEAKSRYQSAEYALSSFRDKNRGLFLNTARIDEQRLQADYLLEQSVYNELSKQLEQAKIKVQEETPVFKVLEPPTIPSRKSGPKRTFIMLGGLIAGTLISLAWLLARFILNKRTSSVA